MEENKNEREKLDQPTQDLINYLNSEEQEGRLTPEQTRELLHLTVACIQEQTAQFYL